MAGIVAVGALLAYAPDPAGYTTIAADTGDTTTTTEPPSPSNIPRPRGVPPTELVALEVQARLPAGYASVGAPTLAYPAEESQDGRYEYRVPLQTQRTLYRVPIVAARLAPGVPGLLRESRTLLVLHRALAPGREYNVQAAQAASRQGALVHGTWRVQFSGQGGAWRVADAGPVTVAAPSTEADGTSVLMSEAEMARVQDERRQALAGYVARVQAVEREADAFGAAALRDVPPSCARDGGALLGEVVRLASDCPSVADPAQRSACFQRRDRANRELGACERQNQLHDARSEAARRSIAVRRGERLAALARELATEAERHRHSLAN